MCSNVFISRSWYDTAMWWNVPGRVRLVDELHQDVAMTMALALVAQDCDETVLNAQRIQVPERGHFACAPALLTFSYLIVPGPPPVAELFGAIALSEILPVDLLFLVGLEEFRRWACIRRPQAEAEGFPGKSLRPLSHNQHQKAKPGAFGLRDSSHICDAGLPKGQELLVIHGDPLSLSLVDI